MLSSSARRKAARLAPGLACALLLAAPAAALAPPAAGDLQRAIFKARDAVLPALVHVEPIVDVFERGKKSKAEVMGSGVIMDAAGHVLTNRHVVENAERVHCVLYDRREMTARVVGRDVLTDLAVLQLELPTAGAHEPPTPPLPTARLGDSATLQAGEFVIAMGSPLGLARSISVGVVSTPDRYFPEDVLPDGESTGEYNTWIQTDAAINPGNSGGPLVDLAGRVIGINARAVPIYGENLGFAIPIDVVKDVARQILASGRVTRSWIGVAWQHGASLGGFLGAGDRGGVVVGSVAPGSPADSAGMAAGDVVVSWDGTPVSARFEEELPRFRKRIADTAVGAAVPVHLLRGGEERTVTVTTVLHPDSEAPEREIEPWGVTVRDITPELARRRRLDDTHGVVVTGTRPDGAAEAAGFEEGDVFRRVEDHAIVDAQDLASTAAALQAAGKTRLLVRAERGSTLRLGVLVLAAEGSAPDAAAAPAKP